MSKIRINDLARELEVKSKAILDVLPLVGVTEKKTHSSSIEEHEASGVTEPAFYVPGIFPTAEAAIHAAVTAGQQKIDSGFEYKSVVEYRQ